MKQSDLARTRLLRILFFAAVAVASLVLLVGGMAAYSATVLDDLSVRDQVKLTERRVERRFEGLREDVASATVWNEAYEKTLAQDQAWMQLNFGDYYADYMGHEVTVAFDGAGTPIYASRTSEAVSPDAEQLFLDAVRPLVEQVRRTANHRRSDGRRDVFGLKAVITLQGVVLVGRQPYFVSVSSVVPEDVEHDRQGVRDPIVISGVSAQTFVKTLSKDLMLTNPRLLPPDAPHLPAQVQLESASGGIVAVIGWTPDRPGALLLRRALPALAGLAVLLLASVALGGLKVRSLIRDLADHQVALNRSLAEAEAANAAKSQFLANMSHELRTPLNGIIAMGELLHGLQVDDKGREMTQTIVSSGHTLEHVVNDILDVGKIEAGMLHFEMAPFSLDEVLKSAAMLHGASAAAKGVELKLTVCPGAGGVYEGDRTRVSQLVSNLVGNAVKFTERGQVAITARRHPRGDLCVSVSDTGIGFDRCTAARLFQRFEQADPSVSRRFGGTGLGLAICEALAVMMGGSVKARSIPGKGSIFFARLHLTRLSACQPPDQTPAEETEAGGHGDGDPLRVLYADDHAVNRQVVGLILEPLGFMMTFAEDGAEAVALVTAASFDLVLMDVQMPVLDGLSATRLIRQFEREHERPRVPIISLTANAMEDDVHRSMAAGSDLHLPKPIRPAALIEAVHKTLSSSVQAQPAPAVRGQTL